MKNTVFSLAFAAGALFGLRASAQQDGTTTATALTAQHIAAKKAAYEAKLDKAPLATPYHSNPADKVIHWHTLRDEFGEASLKKLFSSQNRCKKLRDHMLVFTDTKGQEYQAALHDLENIYRQFVTSNELLGNWHGNVDVVITELACYTLKLNRLTTHAEDQLDGNAVISLHTLQHMSADNIETFMAHEAGHLVLDRPIDPMQSVTDIHAQLASNEQRADSTMFLHTSYEATHDALSSISGYCNHYGNTPPPDEDSTNFIPLRQRHQEFGIIIGHSPRGAAFDNVHPTNASRFYALSLWKKLHEENKIFLKPAPFTALKRKSLFQTACLECVTSPVHPSNPVSSSHRYGEAMSITTFGP